MACERERPDHQQKKNPGI